MHRPRAPAVRSLVLMFVEDHHSIELLTRLSVILHVTDPTIPNLADMEAVGDVILIPTGGQPRQWAHRFAPLRCAEVHIYDRSGDHLEALRQQLAHEIRARGGIAQLTGKRALTNYLHSNAVAAATGIRFDVNDDMDVAGEVAVAKWAARSALSWEDLPPLARHRLRDDAKHLLCTAAVEYMSAELLAESDSGGELIDLLGLIGRMVNYQAVSKEETCPSPR